MSCFLLTRSSRLNFTTQEGVRVNINRGVGVVRVYEISHKLEKVKVSHTVSHTTKTKVGNGKPKEKVCVFYWYSKNPWILCQCGQF